MRVHRFAGKPDGKGREPRSLPALPRVQVRKGSRKTDDGKVGKDQTFFRTEWPEGYEHVQAKFHELYGKEPARLTNILLMSDEMEDSFSSANEEWRAGAKESILICRCDGYTISFLRDGQKVIRNAGMACRVDCDCGPVGRLTFILKDLIDATGEVVMFDFVTRAKSDIERMLAALDFAVAGSGGRLRGVAFNLWREPRKVITPDGMTITKSQVMMGFADAVSQRLARGYAENVLSLAAGDDNTGSPGEHLGIPANVSNGRNNDELEPSLKTVKLQPVVRIYVAGEFTTYAFKSVKGNLTVYSQDTAMVQAAIPNILSLDPDKAQPLDVRGFEATYPAHLEKEGRDIFISSLIAT
jgi:hypothetical protein